MLYLLGYTLIVSLSDCNQAAASLTGKPGLENVMCTPWPSQHLIVMITPALLDPYPMQFCKYISSSHMKNKERLGLGSHTSRFLFWTEESVLLLLEQDLYSLQAGNPLEATGCSTETACTP